MTITKPTLPPKKGYVEAIDETGRHIYIPTADTAIRLKKEAEESAVQYDIDALTVDHEYRLTLLELGVTNDAV